MQGAKAAVARVATLFSGIYGRIAAVIIAALILSAPAVWPLVQSRASGGAPIQDEAVPFVPPPPYVRAKAAALVDLETGAVLYAQDAFARHSPGALVNVVAALTALRRGDVNDEVRVGGIGALSSGALGLNLTEGERFPLGDLVRMMLFRPGHDAATAIAIHTAGSVEAFARQMNADAYDIGATQSRFVAPHDYGEEDASTSAYELALIAAEALRDPYFAEMVRSKRMRVTRREQTRGLLNINSFLNRRPDATGVKTAYDPETGHSLIGSIQQGERRLMVVVLGSPTAADRYKDATGILEYGLAHFEALRAMPQLPRDRYEVREGDTLTGLAKRFGVPVIAILGTNEIADPDDLKSGQILWIPR